MPSGSSKGSGGDSLGSVLLWILILGGGMIGLMLLAGHCSGEDADRPRPATHLDAAARP